jgi:hypothetical protein
MLSLRLEKTLILACLYWLYSILIFVLGLPFSMNNPYLNWVFLLIIWGTAVFFATQLRSKQLETEAQYSLGAAFKDLFFMLALATVASQLLHAVLYLVVDTEVHKQFVDMTMAKMLEANSQIKEKDLERVVSIFEYTSPFKPVGMLIGLVSSLMIQTVFSFVAALFLKKSIS